MNNPLPALMLLCLWVLVGCEEPPKVEKVPSGQYLSIINLEGKEEVIAASELIDPETRQYRAKQVLSLDKQTGKTGYVDVKELQNQSPSQARYQPVTRPNPDFHAPKEIE